MKDIFHSFSIVFTLSTGLLDTTSTVIDLEVPLPSLTMTEVASTRKMPNGACPHLLIIYELSRASLFLSTSA